MLQDLKRKPHLAAAAVCRPSAAEGAVRQGDVLDDLWKMQIDLQQQVLAPLTHRAVRQNKHISTLCLCAQALG